MSRVLIAGAGPAGAAIAYLLAERGAEVTLLERHTDFTREFRGEALMPSGVDALRQMGLEQQLDALPQSRIERAELFANARPLLEIEASDLPDVLALPRLVSQPAMLEMITREARRFPRFRLERGVTVRDLLVDGERVTGLRVDGPEGPREIHADYTIGADGRASVLRRRSGLHEDRPRQSFDIVWCKTPLPPVLGDRRTARGYLAPGHFSLMFPAPDGRLQIGWVIAKGSFGELRARGIEGWIHELAGVVSEDLAEHFRAHADEITHPFLLDVVCDHLERWTRPGLLLVGDASHPMSPVGAQGINIALRDAIVVANHLGPLLGNAAPPGALDEAALRVQNERLPEVREIQALQRAAPRIVFQRNLLARFFVSTVAPLLIRTGLAAGVATRVMGRFANGTTDVQLQPSPGPGIAQHGPAAGTAPTPGS